jgi:dihydrofolate synthase/folylpolyglutamate synthase
MYQRMGKAAYKADLSNTIKLIDYLDAPHKSFKTIHVAGTNGKGSTSHMLASVLQEAGYSVGLYTSPHLKDFRERIKINGALIPKRSVSNFVKNHQPFFEENQLSFFEMTVGLAFDYFRKKQVDIAVIEVGLGGRLDSTNVITPEVSVITNIGLDHTQFLGNTLSEIAKEKAGIIKQNTPVVIGETLPETKPIFEDIAGEHGSPIFFAEENDADYSTDLLGDYQKKNVKSVIETIKLLNEGDWKVSNSDLKRGLNKTFENTGLHGRWQVLREQPKVICDTAHNKEGLSIVMKQVRKEPYKALHIVLGAVNDKNLDTILPLFPEEASYYFCSPNVVRGMPVLELKEQAEVFNLHGFAYESVKEAYTQAIKRAAKGDLIYVGGSTFVVAEIL